MLNYLHWDKTKVTFFTVLLFTWTYVAFIALLGHRFGSESLQILPSLAELGHALFSLVRIRLDAVRRVLSNSPAARVSRRPDPSETSKRWSPKDGVWLVWWMKYQIFVPLLLLQFLNLFWYGLIWRIAFR